MVITELRKVQNRVSTTGSKAQVRWIIVSDLDGTLLDHYTYSFDSAQSALAQLQALNIPLVLNTSKTLRECREIASELKTLSPIIVENGGGIFVPKLAEEGVFWSSKPQRLEESEWIPLGVNRTNVLKAIRELKEKRNLKFTSFSEMSQEKLQEVTGLSASAATAAKSREFSEPLIWQDTPEQLAWFRQKLKTKNLHVVKGGRFHLVSGMHNKGTCLEWIRNHFNPDMHHRIKIVALGDGKNDLPMLEAADISICIRSPINPPLKSENKMIVTTTRVGVDGWNDSILGTLEQMHINR